MAKYDEFGRPPVVTVPAGVEQIQALKKGKKPPPRPER